MLGVQFHNGKSSHYHYSGKKHLDSSSKLNAEKSLKFDQSKIGVQNLQQILEQEVKKASQLVKKIQHQLKKQTRESDNNLLNQLRQMEESIRRKNMLIKALQKDINEQKNGNSKSKIRIDTIMNSMSEEMKQNSNDVIGLKKQLDEKKKVFQQRKQDLKDLFEKYKAKCKAEMKEVVDFNKFKEIQQKTKKQLQKMIKTKSNQKKLKSSIWERQEGGANTERIQNNKIKETLNVRMVAEGALKNERKRHKQEISNLVSKLQFLKDEADLIQQKIRAKQLELNMADKRFSESRNRHEILVSRRPRSNKLKTLG